MSIRVIRRQALTDPGAFGGEIHPVLRRVYARRGLTSRDELEYGLTGLHPIDGLGGMEAALDLLQQALERQQRILIVGDFDADGATSTALAMLALRAMGAGFVGYVVPNRFEYGYGLTPEIVALAARQHPDLLVTVDNGVSSIDGVTAARERGMRVLVTDHHLPGAQLPAADAMVNPNLPGDAFPSKHLAGVGVIFYVLSALRRRLRDTGWFQARGLCEPNLGAYLDLVALGTVADVVPLDHNNRVLVEQGLRRMRAGRIRPGIAALLKAAGRDPARLSASDLGFAVGPRLNAAGRLDDMSLGIECLLAPEEGAALPMAARLNELNRERREIEAGMQAQALAALERLEMDDEQSLPYGLCLYEPDWHEGVVGIVAARIRERYHRPVIAFADAGSGHLKGSARSVPGLHIRDALDAVAAAHPELIRKFGGHAMAAGLSLEAESLEAFRTAFDEEIRRRLTDEDLQGVVHTDGVLHPGEMNLPTAQALRWGGPWGQGFPEPVFDGRFRVLSRRMLGNGEHLKMMLRPEGGSGSSHIEAIAFRFDREPPPQDARVELVYRINVNEYRGESRPQLIVEHLFMNAS